MRCWCGPGTGCASSADTSDWGALIKSGCLLSDGKHLINVP